MEQVLHQQPPDPCRGAAAGRAVSPARPAAILTDMRVRRGWAAVAVVAVVVSAGLVAWLYLAAPRIEPGSRSGMSGGVRRVGSPTAPTRYEIDAPDTGTVWLSVRNAGRVPVTVRGLLDGGSSPLSDVRWGAVPRNGDVSSVTMGTRPVRLPPDREAYVELGVKAPPCVAFEPGAALNVESVRLRVRSLGRDEVVTAPLRLTMHFRTARPASPSCP